MAAMVARYASRPVPLVAGAPAAAARIAARVPVAIASAAHPAVIRAAVEAAGLASVFSTVVSADDVPRGKPAPDVYLEAARRLGVAPARCLVIEDSRNGVLAGRAAGARVVLVPNASVPPGPGVAELADAVIERLSDLPLAWRRERPHDHRRSARIGPQRRAWQLAAGDGSRTGSRRSSRASRSEPTCGCGSRGGSGSPRGQRSSASTTRAGPTRSCSSLRCPLAPDLLFFGPREADMRIGRKNRLIALSQRAIPFRPDKRGLVDVARRVDAVFARGSRLAIAPEGRIHAGERVVLPFDDGAAYFAVRAGVPVVPVAILGMSWLRFGGTVRVRIGDPLPVIPGRATREAVAAMTAATHRALLDLVADGRDREPPGPFGRWLTEVVPGLARRVATADRRQVIAHAFDICHAPGGRVASAILGASGALSARDHGGTPRHGSHRTRHDARRVPRPAARAGRISSWTRGRPRRCGTSPSGGASSPSFTTCGLPRVSTTGGWRGSSRPVVARPPWWAATPTGG